MMYLLRPIDRKTVIPRPGLLTAGQFLLDPIGLLLVKLSQSVLQVLGVEIAVHRFLDL